MQPKLNRLLVRLKLNLNREKSILLFREKLSYIVNDINAHGGDFTIIDIEGKNLVNEGGVGLKSLVGFLRAVKVISGYLKRVDKEKKWILRNKVKVI